MFFLVTITAWNLTQLVIVITLDCFAFAFDVVEALADCSSNLVSGSVIIVLCEWIISCVICAPLGWRWQNQQVAFIKGPPEFIDC